MTTPDLYQLVFYVPLDHAEAVKLAVFEAGGGRIGSYDRCCWQTVGTGQFRPLPSSQPFLGTTGEVERVEEARVELVVAESELAGVLDALLQAHPYETPAYSFWPINRLPAT
jgi:hypothetical protein